MKLKHPVANFIPLAYPQGDVTQFFGENKALYSQAICYPAPLGCLQGHNGWDIVRAYGTPIMAVSKGKVVEARSSEDGYGRDVRILDENNYEWIYAHLSEISCTLGQLVNAGDVIGKMGNTGFVVSGSTPYWSYNPYAGTHLHLGRRLVLPWDGTGGWNVSYATGDRGNIQNYGNGFFGSVPFSADDFEGFTPPPKPSFKFMRDLEYGMMNDPDVKKLQDILKYEGLMAQSIPSTGNYLEETRKSVLAFQKKYQLITPYQEWTYRGKYCYQVTRAKLNALYGTV